MQKRNIVVFINNFPENGADEIIELQIELAVICEKQEISWIEELKRKGVQHILCVDYDDPVTIDEAIDPLRDRLLAITCRSDSNITDFCKVIPHVPELQTPTIESLHCASNKAAMRERFEVYSPEITPRFLSVKDSSASTINRIENEIKYPLVIKPAHLFLSLLVSQCESRGDLKHQLDLVFNKIESIYRQYHIKSEPTVLVEAMMRGDKYSVDAYIDSNGQITFCPIISIRTGYDIGIEDFFEYETTNRVTLSKKDVEDCLKVATKSVHALGLTNTSAHIELRKCEASWRVT